MAKQRVLTGITTTGTPHLGNYVGAIRPFHSGVARFNAGFVFSSSLIIMP